MSDHPNATLIRNALEQMATSGSMSAQADLLADDVEWHEIGRDEPIRGKEALMARIGEIPEGGSMSLDIHDVLANDEHAIALVTATATMGDQSLTYRTAEIHHMRNGKITHRWAYSDDTQRINEFFAPLMD